MIDANIQHLRGYIRGPSNSKHKLNFADLNQNLGPYAGSTFVLDIQVPDSYPFKPPVCKFVTRIWHPNISSQTGTICLDILKDNWWVFIATHSFLFYHFRAASMTLRTILLSIQALLTSPEPKVSLKTIIFK